ncbi:hypothetical protein BCR34DRAFT_552386 [Clohesyomyces aquaticus]|uniref:DUF7907 domain-containing protein n=1 Tax=Clohesyomyces aquaticus TaxID=1231657 RepID=A0A1Y2AAL7_9PLEO|nr:hypothetical protein BCR34DRAFT_552386 [Clohesyomyces aquaticus]
MKSYLALLTLTAFATAQDYAAKRSPPFHLIVISAKNQTLNGTALSACHEGAAIEGFCRGPKLSDQPAYGTTFYFNTTYETNETIVYDNSGSLDYDLVIGDNQIVPSAMQLVIDPTSNVATPIIYPGGNSYTAVFFDKSEEMYIQSWRDDTVDPAVSKEEKVKQWYICTTYYSYTYTTLAWVVGKHARPQNPTCQKVTVKRVWA